MALNTLQSINYHEELCSNYICGVPIIDRNGKDELVTDIVINRKRYIMTSVS